MPDTHSQPPQDPQPATDISDLSEEQLQELKQKLDSLPPQPEAEPATPPEPKAAPKSTAAPSPLNFAQQIPQDPKGFLMWLRNCFFTGLFVAFPLIITIWFIQLIYSIVNSASDPIVRALVYQYREFIPESIIINGSIPGAGMFITLFLLLALGIIASNFLGQKMFQWIDKLLRRIPVINAIYNLASQIVDSFKRMSKPGGFAGKQVVYIRYPGLQGYLLGFLTGRFMNADGEAMAAVFIPTAPNPITGFVLVFKESEILLSDLQMDVAWRLIISAGLVPPIHVKYPVRPLATMHTNQGPTPPDTTQIP